MPWIIDSFVSTGMKGTGPRNKNAIAIDKFPQIDTMVGYFNLSQIFKKM